MVTYKSVVLANDDGGDGLFSDNVIQIHSKIIKHFGNLGCKLTSTRAKGNFNLIKKIISRF